MKFQLSENIILKRNLQSHGEEDSRDLRSMPLEGLEEQGLAKNPDMRLVQLRFLLSVGGVAPEPLWTELVAAVKEKGEYRPGC